MVKDVKLMNTVVYHGDIILLTKKRMQSIRLNLSGSINDSEKKQYLYKRNLQQTPNGN